MGAPVTCVPKACLRPPTCSGDSASALLLSMHIAKKADRDAIHELNGNGISASDVPVASTSARCASLGLVLDGEN
jgi:hypothetical protein